MRPMRTASFPVWANGSLWIYPGVLKRIAPGRFEEIERLTPQGLSKSVSEPSDDLLAALTAVHRDAAAGRA